MTVNDLCWLPATELVARIRRKELSPVELTETVLARIERVNPRVNAFCTIPHDLARQAAKIAEAAVLHGEPLGPLHGVPLSVKDLVFTRGIATTGGSRIFADFVPEEDAVAVERLKAAGAVIVGKTNTPEFGHKGVTDNPLFGVTRNPWRLDRTAGGSSGGAGAAVAAGLAPLALGTDGGGSIRIPASFCGIYGFKPSFGRIPNAPGFPGWETFSVLGPMTRTVRDAALMLDVLAGPDDRDRHSLPATAGSSLAACEEPIPGWSVAWSPDLGYARVDPEVARISEDAAAVFEALGCRVETVATGWENPEEIFAVMAAAETCAAWGDRLPEWGDRMDPTLIRVLERGRAVTLTEYLKAAQRRREFWAHVQGFLSRFDLLLTPTVAVAPFGGGGFGPREIAGQGVTPLGWMPFTYPFNLTGQPAATVPAGFTADGLPVGLQIVGKRHADQAVLAASAAFEAARPWASRRPPLDGAGN
ncbi:MAG: amidase [Candidatus Rokubacteria bacterium]|nr:amidase [Candidatus Rokubacteria bacterium]